MTVYHYTKGMHLPSIMAHGLTPSSFILAEGEHAVLWFTIDPIWENTVFLGTLEDAYRQAHSVGGLVRISCDDRVAPYTFKALKKVAKIPTRLHRSLETSAHMVGADPRDWRGTIEHVPPADFVSVDVFNGRVWVPYQAGSKAA